MLALEAWVDNKSMHRQGWSIRGIAKELDVGLNIVRRYLREETPSAYRPRPKRPSILDPYKDYLRARLLDKPEICAKVLPSEPPARGYPGVGYAHQGFHPGGRKLYGLSYVLSWSTTLFVYFTTRTVGQELLFDNPNTVMRRAKG